MASRPNPAEEGFRAALALREQYEHKPSRLAAVVGIGVLCIAFSCKDEKEKPATGQKATPETIKSQPPQLGAIPSMEEAVKRLFYPPYRR